MGKCLTHDIEMKESIEADTVFLYCPKCEPEIEDAESGVGEQDG